MSAIGTGYSARTIHFSEVREIVQQAVDSDIETDLNDKRVLLIIPDNTRTCPIGLMYREIYAALSPKVKCVDVLIALGTHMPMAMEDILKFLEIEPGILSEQFPKTQFFNHAWSDPKQMKKIGNISAKKMAELSGGRMEATFKVAINKIIFDYDQLIVVGPTFPHEVVGYSGGNKYFFPGIAGPEIINAFHWLGALITNREIIGTHYTPVRAVVDYCAAMITVPKYCFSLVVSSKGLHGLFAGSPEDAYEKAASLSAQVNVKWYKRPFHTVLSMCPTMYPELWTAGKCMYKLEPVVEKGGTLIIYAPHMAEISKAHGEHILEIGYHCLEYFTKQPDRFTHIPGGVLAHSTHVRGTGHYDDGVEHCDVNVILASAVSEEMCKKINLGYLDPATIDVEGFANREDEGVLLVRKAGEVLYKLESHREE